MKLVNKPYRETSDTLVSHFKSNIKLGLTLAQVKIHYRLFGSNVILSLHKRSPWRILLEQFISPLVYVLFAAALLAYIFGQWLEGTAIIFVILINAAIGFFMENQARISMESLKKLSRHQTRVIRAGDIHVIDNKRIVPGDIIMLEAGDMVPADARVAEARNLAINESILTGESIPVFKNLEVIPEKAAIFERSNMLYKGTSVVRGNGKAIVTATGKHTELGMISDLTQNAAEELTPLEQRLKKLSQKLIGFTFLLAFIILLIGLFRGNELYFMVETAVALAVAAIPEGLPIVATIALANGMLRLARHKVIVKNLNAVETLGETQVIFTDKTGTLTENKLFPDELVSFNWVHSYQNGARNARESVINSTIYKKAKLIGILCNNATYDKDHQNWIGDPLEIALVQIDQTDPAEIEKIRTDFSRLKELPFDSDIKMMGTLHNNAPRGDYLVCIKGAYEAIINECDYVMVDSKVLPIDNNLRKHFNTEANLLAEKGSRVLALAYAEISEIKEDFFKNLILIGLIGFIDPPRQDIRQSVELCKQAGIRVSMLTGDHLNTAMNIAGKTGLIDPNDTESGISLLSETKLNDISVTEKTVFARVNPAQKLELVDLFQQAGFTVGMTGDGVNDAPALKKADIGIAMGFRGTETAKEASDLILKDDSFNSIVVAIKQGRGIFENIRHFVVYLLSCNLSELLVVAIAFMANLPSPLLPLQILFINMVTDVFPALGLGLNKEPENIMKLKPRTRKEAILTGSLWISIWVYALGITIATLAALYWAMWYFNSSIMANNIAFYTLILAQLWHLLNLARGEQSFFNNEITRNPYIWLAILLCIIIVLVSYLIPITKEILQLQALDLKSLLVVFGFSLIPIFLIQICKKISWIE